VALAAPDAVRRLAYNGHATQTFALIKELNPDQQATILAAHGACLGWPIGGRRSRPSR
jgi:hypothetical protein